MNLTEMSAEYRVSASLLKARIAELTSTLNTKPMCEMEKMRMRARIDGLLSMYRDTAETAAALERYYDRRYRINARFKI